MSEEKLDQYNSMRRFDRTTEPQGGAASDGDPRFVVQKHAATRLHYDVRFEVDGVMPSWAVPKGPSYDPGQKRLAVHTEDHPLDYQYFEGDIPKEEYGGGSVIVWDAGTYENASKKNGRPISMADAIAGGHFSVRLNGEKLHGGWSFTRTGPKGDKDQWVMVKRKDETAQPDLDITARTESVRSEALLPDDAGAEAPPDTDVKSEYTWRPPMLAKLADNVSGDDWTFEPKLDGLRCIAVRRGGDVHLFSRNQLSYDAQFPHVRRALATLPVDNFVLDGELATFEGSRTSFAALRGKGGGSEQSVYCVFDLLELLGKDTTGLPIGERKALLAKALEPSGPLRVVEPLEGKAQDLLAHACAEGWEGIVAKRVGSTYTEGRSSAWVKLKCTAGQEFVIGGWTEPKGARSGFGALLVGYFDNGEFRYAGKVGTGFSTDLLQSLYKKLAAGERQSSPFVDDVKEKTAHWCTPKLVAQVAFTEWTGDGKLRHPSFQGLREDKAPESVVRERK